MRLTKEFGLFIIILIFLYMKTASALFPLLSKTVDFFTPKRIKTVKTPTVTLVVEIPMSSVQYAKPMDVKAGGKFYLETPKDHYAYSSSGRSKLHRVNVVYLMQSMYQPNLMCFFLHFWSMKDPTIPWNVPHVRITPPPWFRKRNPQRQII